MSPLKLTDLRSASVLGVTFTPPPPRTKALHLPAVGNHEPLKQRAKPLSPPRVVSQAFTTAPHQTYSHFRAFRLGVPSEEQVSPSQGSLHKPLLLSNL